MPETATSLGHAIFSGIEKDEYLNEIYDALLHNYFLKLLSFKLERRKKVTNETVVYTVFYTDLCSFLYLCF